MRTLRVCRHRGRRLIAGGRRAARRRPADGRSATSVKPLPASRPASLGAVAPAGGHRSRTPRRGPEDLVHSHRRGAGRPDSRDRSRAPLGRRAGSRRDRRPARGRPGRGPTTAIELRGSSSATWRYRRSAWSTGRASAPARPGAGARSSVGPPRSRGRAASRRRLVVERRVRDDALEQRVEDPAERGPGSRPSSAIRSSPSIARPRSGRATRPAASSAAIAPRSSSRPSAAGARPLPTLSASRSSKSSSSASRPILPMNRRTAASLQPARS